ncbi:MAG: hypothetical protein M1834_006124 [Cirrosporium novae-zelandiae]|nr:MAG: hypothetical protein M1834_006124 [Cirrosporium novae-zelandiae]
MQFSIIAVIALATQAFAAAIPPTTYSLYIRDLLTTTNTNAATACSICTTAAQYSLAVKDAIDTKEVLSDNASQAFALLNVCTEDLLKNEPSCPTLMSGVFMKMFSEMKQEHDPVAICKAVSLCG